MVIELLEFKVAPTSREKFIEQDRQVWTAALAKYPGFLGKEVWLDTTKPEQVILVIRWQTRKQWQAIPQEDLDKIEQRFTQAMGKDFYELVAGAEYQIRQKK